MYRFHCAPCTTTWEAYARIAECQRTPCPTCGQIAAIVINRETAPYTQSPALDNHYYNNGQGTFDEGLGCVVRTRAQREQVMRQRGLETCSRTDGDRMIAQSAAQKTPKDEMVECLEHAAYDVRYGRTPPPSPIPDQARATLGPADAASRSLLTEGGYSTVESGQPEDDL